jgi:hypothetical protein
LSADGKCDCKFTRSYWLPCRHVIYMFESLGLIEEPNWADFAEQFDESGFEIYNTRALVDVDDKIEATSRDLEAKLITSEAWIRYGPAFLRWQNSLIRSIRTKRIAYLSGGRMSWLTIRVLSLVDH